jgi:hypothetical protein
MAPTAEEDQNGEIDMIVRGLDQHGLAGRGEPAELVGARHSGRSRFEAAFGEAAEEGRAKRLSPTTFGPADRRSRRS